jgi:hypothetical protein
MRRESIHEKPASFYTILRKIKHAYSILRIFYESKPRRALSLTRFWSTIAPVFSSNKGLRQNYSSQT